MTETIDARMGLKEIDLSVAHDGLRVQIPSPATGVIVKSRDAECDIWWEDDADAADDAARGTVLQNTGWRTKGGVFQPPAPIREVYVFNDAAESGDTLVLAYFVGASLRQGTDRFSDFIFPPAPITLYEEASVSISMGATEAEYDLFNDFPVSSFQEVVLTAQDPLTLTTAGDDEADYIKLVIEVFDAADTLLETFESNLYVQADGTLSNNLEGGRVVADNPDMEYATAKIVHKDGVGGGVDAEFDIDSVVAFGVS